MPVLRVFILAEDPLVRAGLAGLLSQPVDDRPGLVLVGQGPGFEELAAGMALFKPDVALWDLGMDPVTARSHLEGLPISPVPLVLLAPASIRPDPGLFLRSPGPGHASVRSPAGMGLVNRQASAASLASALQAAAEGLVVLDPVFAWSGNPAGLPRASGTKSFAASEAGQTEEDFSMIEPLTPREVEVLQLMAEGLPNKSIAQRLGISAHTIKYHVNAILSKLGAQSRTEAVTRAARAGLMVL